LRCLAKALFKLASPRIIGPQIDGCEQLFGQQLIGNCHSARGEDGAFEDDGEATTAVNRKAPMKMIAEAYITASTAVIGGDAYQ
jgi:hypothetical protein